MPDLKPCPFCGGRACMVESRVSSKAGVPEPARYGVCCGECRNGTWKWYGNEAEAAAAWNRRACDE